MTHHEIEEEIVQKTFGDMEEADDSIDFDETAEKMESKEEIIDESITTSARSTPTLDPTQYYLREIGFVPLLTPEEELHYARLYVKGDVDAKKRMIEGNLRLVVKISRNYINRGMSYLDLIEEGNLGLMHALEKFDPERGFRFSTYATWWIKQTIERAIMNQTRTIRLPIHIIKELNIYLRAGKKLAKKLGHEPSPEEIAEAIDKPVEDVRKMLELKEGAVSLDSTIRGDSEKTLVDLVPDEKSESPEEILDDTILSEHLNEYLNELDEKHREVLMRRFGLGAYGEKQTFETIGEAIGLSRERVRQVQSEGLRALKEIITKAGLTPSDLF